METSKRATMIINRKQQLLEPTFVLNVDGEIEQNKFQGPLKSILF